MKSKIDTHQGKLGMTTGKYVPLDQFCRIRNACRDRFSGIDKIPKRHGEEQSREFLIDHKEIMKGEPGADRRKEKIAQIGEIETVDDQKSGLVE